MNNGRGSVQLLAPILQVLAVSDNIPVPIVAISFISSYLGFFLGNYLKKTRERQTSVVNLLDETRDLQMDLGENRVSSKRAHLAEKQYEKIFEEMRIYFTQKGFLENTKHFVYLAALVFTGGKEAFGTLSFTNASLNSINAAVEYKVRVFEKLISSQIIKLVADFIKKGSYFVKEKQWNEWTETQPSTTPLIQDNDKNLIIKTENFQAQIEDILSPELTIEIRAGNLYMFDGDSGDGKSIFLHAIRGELPHKGNAYINLETENQPTNIRDVEWQRLQKSSVYFSTDDLRAIGGRVVDLFSESFLQKNQHDFEQLSESDFGIQMIIASDKKLEYQIHLYHQALKESGEENLKEKECYGLKNEHIKEQDWERMLFNKKSISLYEFLLLVKLRSEKLSFAADKLSTMGKNMGFPPEKTLGSLSTGMLVRSHLASKLNGKEELYGILIIDEPLGKVDEKAAENIILEICALLKENKKLAVIVVSHPYKKLIERKVKEELGADRFKSMQFETA